MTGLCRPCPLCEACDAGPWLVKHSLRLVRCRQCGMAYADPIPTGMGDAYYDELGRPYYLSPDKLAGDFAATRFDRELALFRRFCPRGEVLDVGCGTGAFLFQLGQRHPGTYRATGIEVSRPVVQHARALGLDVVDGSLLTHDFGERAFDAVTFWAVLEHLADPVKFVRRATELLRFSGHCLALVPNADSLAVRVLGPRYRYLMPQHLNYFSTATLTRLLADAGLEVIVTGGSHFNPMVLWHDWRRGTDAAVPDAERATLLRHTTRLKGSPWLGPARFMVGRLEKLLAASGRADNIWAVARKR